MPDREKVIKWLEECQKPEYSCMHCPYYLVVDESAADEAVVEHCSDQLMRDALALIREQEPVEPAKQHIENPKVDLWYCGECGKWIGKTFAYCPWCGKKVKWDA